VSTKPIGPVVAAAHPTLIKTPSEGAREWEAEIAADPEGRQVVWKSKPMPVTPGAARMTANRETGTFAGDGAGAAKGEFVGGKDYTCRCRERDAAGQWSPWSPWHQPFRVEGARQPD
jgi:hypothetical protein